jgi:hypothetical protein
VDHRAGLGDVKKRKFVTLPGLELRPLGRPTRSQSLYRLPNVLTTYFNVHVFVYAQILLHAELCRFLCNL